MLTIEQRSKRMREYEFFKLTVRDDGIALFYMDRPDCMNAMKTECWLELKDFIEYAQQDKNIRVIILGSAVPKVFIAGADIREFRELPPEDGLFSDCTVVMNVLERCTKPIITTVAGVAFGAGFEIALASDIRIVTEKAKFGLPEVSLGVMPGNGGTYRLAKTIGVGRAKEVILAGRIIRGAEAVDLGLAMECVPAEELEEAAIKVAQRMLNFGPKAMAIAKQCINIGYTATFETSQFIENLGFCALMGTAEMKEGTAAFLEKRKPNF